MHVDAETSPVAAIMAPRPPPSAGEHHHGHVNVNVNANMNRHHHQHRRHGGRAPHSLPPERTITPELGGVGVGVGGGGSTSVQGHRGQASSHQASPSDSPHHNQQHDGLGYHNHNHHHRHRGHHHDVDDHPPHRPGPAPPSEWPSPRAHQQQRPRASAEGGGSASSASAGGGEGGSPPAVSPAPTATSLLSSPVNGPGPGPGLGPGPGAGSGQPQPGHPCHPSSPLSPPRLPPPGPLPLLLTRREVDEAYDVLSAVLSCLDNLGVPHALIGTTLLGSVRSKSLPFHEDAVEVAVIDDEEVSSEGTADNAAASAVSAAAVAELGLRANGARVCRYERVVRDMPMLLRREARARARALAEAGETDAASALEYTYHVRPAAGGDGGGGTCDRVTSALAPRVGVNVFVLRRYRTPRDLLRVISVNDDGRTARPLAEIERIMTEIESSASASAAALMRTRGRDGTGRPFPLYHFDNRAAVALRPRQYLLPDELLPIRREYDFGPVRGAAPGPNFPVRALRRFHGDDCFTHYTRATRHGNREVKERVPLSDEQYVPMQHSRPERRVPYAHGRRELDRYLSSQEGWYTASADGTTSSEEADGGGSSPSPGGGGARLQIPDMDEPHGTVQPRLQRALPSMHSRQIFGMAHLQQPKLEERRQQQQQRQHGGDESVGQPQPQRLQLAPSTDTRQWSLLSSSMMQQQQQSMYASFAAAVRRHTNSSPDAPEFDQRLREVVEPYIAQARAERDRAREATLAAAAAAAAGGAGRGGSGDAFAFAGASFSSSSYGGGDRAPPQSALQRAAARHATLRVPYPKLRSERPFLFDPATYPLHRALSDTIGVDDLSLLHEHPIEDKRVLFDALLHRNTRRTFHECYDNFVTGFCVPLLHSLAMTQGTFDSNATTMMSSSGMMMMHHHHRRAASGAGGGGATAAMMIPDPALAGFSGVANPDAILYRYQAFPSIRVVRPGEASTDPHCDAARGHSVGNINFHIPLTPSFGTNALYAESHPGREDWHPLGTKSLGLGYVYDGARCVHFGLVNTTDRTRVSLSFRVAVARCSSSAVLRGRGGRVSPPATAASTMMDDRDVDMDAVDDSLCSDRILRDAYSSAGPGYYDEAVIDTGTAGGPVGPGGQRFASSAAMMMAAGGGGPGVVVRKCRAPGCGGAGAAGMLLDPDERVGFPFS